VVAVQEEAGKILWLMVRITQKEEEEEDEGEGAGEEQEAVEGNEASIMRSKGRTLKKEVTREDLGI
jgi:hypothetical protein